MVVLAAVVVGDNRTCVGSPAGLFREPLTLSDLRRLRANGPVPQRRSQERPRNSFRTSLSYAGIPSSQAVSALVCDIALERFASGTRCGAPPVA